MYIFLLIFLFWYISSGYNDLFFILVGVVSSIYSLYFSQKLLKSKIQFKYNLFYFIKYLLWLYIEIIKSAMQVIKIIWMKDLNINPKFGYIEVDLKDNLAKLMLANSISLTPGTITLEINENKFYVHALEAKNFDDLKKNEIANMINKII